MTDSFLNFTTLVVQKFTEIHKIDQRKSYIQLITAFITCFSMMSPEDRMKCITALNMLLKDIGLERFEDGTDFASFMLEKTEEHRAKGDFVDDKDVDRQ